MIKLLGSIREDYKQIPMGVKLIIFVIFLRSMGWGFADPFYSIYLYQFAKDYTLVGLFAGVLSFSSLISIIPLMKLADKTKEKILIQDGEALYLLVVLGYVVSGFFKSLPLLFITIFFNGIAQSLIVVGTETYISKYGAPGKTRPFALYIAMDYLGWIIGMLVASVAFVHYGLNLMFLFVLPSIFASFYILPKIKEKGFRSLIAGFKHYFHSSRDVIRIFQDFKNINSKTVFFLVISFFDGVVYMFTFVFIPLFGLSLNMSFQSIAILMALMYMPFILSFYFTEVLQKFSKMNIIAISLFIGSLSFVLLYFIVHSHGILMLSIIISLSMAVVRPIYNGAIVRLSQSSMLGEMIGIKNLVQRFGRIIGPVLTGLVADLYGLPVTFLIIAVVALGLGIASLILRGYDYIITPKFLVPQE